MMASNARSDASGLRLSNGERALPDIMQNASAPIRNAMSVDVEDFFQVQAFAGTVERSSWDSIPRRVEANTDKVLALFSDAGITATFFILGWIAERHPDLVRRIVEQGHELASHGYAHVPVYEQTPTEFRADVRRTKKLL